MDACSAFLSIAGAVFLAAAVVAALKTIPAFLLAGGSKEDIRFGWRQLFKAGLYLAAAFLISALPAMISWFTAGGDILGCSW